MRITILTAVLLLAAAPAYANSPELQAVTVEASSCQVYRSAGAPPRLALGDWALNANGIASLLCPIQVAGKAGLILDSMRVLYRDGDSQGPGSNVRVNVRITRIINTQHADGQGFGTFENVTTPCEFVSHDDGFASFPIPAQAWATVDVPCKAAVEIPARSHAVLFVELRRNSPNPSKDFVAAFAGVDFP